MRTINNLSAEKRWMAFLVSSMVALAVCLTAGGYCTHEAFAAQGVPERHLGLNAKEVSDGAFTAKARSDSKLKTAASALTSSKKSSKLKLNKTKIVLESGSSAKLAVKGTDGKSVKWRSSNKKVARVSKTGKVKAIASGNAMITARIGTKKLTCRVSVSPKPSATSLKLPYGTSQTIKISGTGGKAVTWKSSNPKVAKVVARNASSARVKAAAAGSSTIIAKVNGKVAKCKVIVTGSLSATEVSIAPFDTVKLELKGAKAREWVSSDPTAVSVSQDGILSAGSEGVIGSATITCTDTQGEHYECIAHSEAPRIEFNETMGLGVTYQWYVNFSLTNRTGESIVFAHTEIIHRPYGDDSDSEVLLGIRSANISDDYFSERPLVVRDGEWVQFNAYAGYHFNDGWPSGSNETRTYQLRITVHGRDCAFVITPDGTIERFWPI